jgi:hypothetical protein
MCTPRADVAERFRRSVDASQERAFSSGRPLLLTTEALRVQGFSLDGARGTRTPDLLGAIQALFQLSYSPEVREV